MYYESHGCRFLNKLLKVNNIEGIFLPYHVDKLDQKIMLTVNVITKQAISDCSY